MLWGEGWPALCRDSFKCYGFFSLLIPLIFYSHLFRFLNFSNPFSFYRLIISSLISSSLLLPLPLSPSLSTYHPIFVLLCHLSSPLSHIAASRPMCSVSWCQSESKNHLHLLHLTLLSSTVYRPQGFQVINSTLKIDFNCTIVCELMKLYFTRLFCICVMKHANEARSQGRTKTPFLSKPISAQLRGRLKAKSEFVCSFGKKQT